MARLRSALRDDGLAMTCQTLGQYRDRLLAALAGPASGDPDRAPLVVEGPVVDLGAWREIHAEAGWWPVVKAHVSLGERLERWRWVRVTLEPIPAPPTVARSQRVRV